VRNTWTLMTALALLIAVASAGLAQSADPAAKPAANPAATKVDPSAALLLRARMHRTMADLMEAQAQAPAAPVAPGWRCPWGTPAVGPGTAWGGSGRGAGGGRGAGWGRGRGPGWGGGPGYGHGAGWGAGAGWGPGFVDRDGDGICDNLQQRTGQK